MVFSREAGPLKIATFNINNVNKRLHNLATWVTRAQPDVVCLQELKVEQVAFPASALRDTSLSRSLARGTFLERG
jgi:exodeoxyribonuclease-3